MKELLLGTHNRHKIEEISVLLSGLPLKVKTLNDFPGVAPVEETGQTLEENAALKAEAYSRLTGLLTLADDTGLEVEALGGQPGVLSARLAGEHCSYLDNNRKLIQMLSGFKGKKRAARFRCVIALKNPGNGAVQTLEGAIQGEILNSLQGGNGFGYDPVFYLPDLKKTLAELTLDEKNKVSHRAIALEKTRKALEKLCRES